MTIANTVLSQTLKKVVYVYCIGTKQLTLANRNSPIEQNEVCCFYEWKHQQRRTDLSLPNYGSTSHSKLIFFLITLFTAILIFSPHLYICRYEIVLSLKMKVLFIFQPSPLRQENQ